jgi:hypothetical protein
MKLILIHGRSQQQKDPTKLVAEWKDAIVAGYQKASLQWSDDVDVVFPFYGDDLDRLVQQVNGPLLTNILLRGEESISENDDLRVEILAEMVAATGISNAEVLAQLEGDAAQRGEAIARGPQNWRFVLAMLRALDHTPLGGRAIDEVTRDVWVYLTYSGIQRKIDAIVDQAIPEEPCVVVAHSLGTVVAYNVLSKRGASAPDVPLFLTVGSPLGIKAISGRLKLPLTNPPGVKHWVNARDPRDVVALHPLTAAYFDILPAIEDFSRVDNASDNRHSIEGYLSDPFVARCIDGAL